MAREAMHGIVVGVDGSDGSRRALEWAADEARRRGTPLTVVYAWHPSVAVYAGSGWTAVDESLFEDLLRAARERLDHACAQVAPALEGLDVEVKVIEGATAPALMDEASDAEMLVVGTRGHGGFAGLLLGSVSAQCAHHCSCPLVIVPSPHGRAPEETD
jgi:nucleotide-binding universal stress UspA family protein